MQLNSSDLKPDNLLIDEKGHLKLTDFGLSVIGFLGRRVNRVSGPNNEPLSAASDSSNLSVLRSLDVAQSSPKLHDPSMFRPTAAQTSTMQLQVPSSSSQDSEKFSSSLLLHTIGGANSSRRSSIASFASSLLTDDIPSNNSRSLKSNAGGRAGFAGTPDYLAPESILGLEQNASVDWWAMGVILYEFLYGIPPFHAATPAAVFENILARNFSFHDDKVEISGSARDLICRLLCLNVENRIGCGNGGAEEIKIHSFFAGLHWDLVYKMEAAFIPKVENDKDTSYFDTRGAKLEEKALDPANGDESRVGSGEQSFKLQAPSKLQEDFPEDPGTGQADFGAFVYKNLNLLERQNSDIVRKLRSDGIHSSRRSLDGDVSPQAPGSRHMSLPAGLRRPRMMSSVFDSSVIPTALSPLSALKFEATPHDRRHSLPYTPSPAISLSSLDPLASALDFSNSSTISQLRSSGPSAPCDHEPPPSTDRLPHSQSTNTNCPSSMGLAHSSSFANNLTFPAFVGFDSCSSVSPSSPVLSTVDLSLNEIKSVSRHLQVLPSPSFSNLNSTQRLKLPKCSNFNVLIADDNPITSKIFSHILKIHYNATCVTVKNGVDAVRYAMGAEQFDLIFMDILMPIIDGEMATRMIKSMNGINHDTMVVAITAYEFGIADESVFDFILFKPITVDSVRRFVQSVL